MIPKEKVLVALSGGVDSAVAALLALRSGKEVVAATLDMTPGDPALAAAWSCGANAREAVDAIVRKLSVEHRYLACFDRFRDRVLLPCCREYASGRTPNPCCLCNAEIKFGILLEFAEAVGAKTLITGHYAKMTPEGLIERGDDPAKDQSYFLCRLRRDQLARIDFPLGRMAKREVRELAAESALPVASRPDSQDACFQIPGEGFAETLFRLFGAPPRPGLFRYQGKTVGKHPGVHRFTLGQRKGLKVALGVPGYVRGIDAASGDIELVTDPGLLDHAVFSVKDLNWQTTELPGDGETLEIQVRYRTPAVPGRVRLTKEGAEITLTRPLRAITPGQAAVFYRGRVMLGGGVIEQVGEPS